MLTRIIRPQLAEQYSDMLAQDFRLRHALLSSYCHTFRDLNRFDKRILEYLKGMILLKEHTSDYLNQQLQEPLSAGGFFSIALFAANTNDEFLMSGCLGLIQALPPIFPAFCCAVNWMSPQSELWPLLMALPVCRAYAAVTRGDIPNSVNFNQQDIQTIIDQGQCVDFLLSALYSSASPLFTPTLETLFSSGRDELIFQGCRAIVCSDSMSTEHIDAATEQLYRLTRSNKKDLRNAAVKYLLAHQTGIADSLLNEMIDEGADSRLLIQAMGWSGLAKFIPTLMDYYDVPKYAKLSALSVISITGSLPEQDGWQRKKEVEMPSKLTHESDDIPEHDPEQGMCWPDKTAFAGWWQTHQGRFSSDTHYLCGQPTTQEGLNTVLNKGYLNLRPMAFIRQGMFAEKVNLPSVNTELLFNLPA